MTASDPNTVETRHECDYFEWYAIYFATCFQWKGFLSSQKTYWKLQLYLYSYQECVFWLLRVVGQLPCDAVPEKTYLIFMRIKWMRSTIMWKRIKTEVLTNTYISLSKRKLWFYITKKHLKNIWNTNLDSWFHDIEKLVREPLANYSHYITSKIPKNKDMRNTTTTAQR